MKFVELDIDELAPFPGNPKRKTKRVFESLVRSIREYGFVDPVVVWKNAEDFGYKRNTIIGGHRRLDALRWLVEHERYPKRRVPCVFIEIESIAKAKALNIALNQISEEFDREILVEWLNEIKVDGFDIRVTGFDDKTVRGIGEGYVRDVKPPIYRPQRPEPPAISELYNREKTEELIALVESADISDEVKKFLRAAAERFTEFNFKNCAEFYAHSSPEVQRLMEKLALVIVDVGQAIENGFMRMTNQLLALIGDDEIRSNNTES